MFKRATEPSYFVLEDREEQGQKNDEYTPRSRPHQESLLCRLFPWVASAVAVFALCLMSFKFGQEYQSAMPAQSVFELLRQTPINMTELGLRPSTLFPKPLGKKVLMLDVDTRPWRIETDRTNQTALAWGRLNHYIYAKLHNYDYKFIRAASPPKGVHPTWVKVLELKRILAMSNTHGPDFVVFTDSDVMFPHLNIPLENLLSHWNITKDISLAASLDPNATVNYDAKGAININTGFMVLQKSPRTDALLKDWIECPTNTKYKGCGKWKTKLYHEQSALSEYLRYDAEHAPAIKEIGCGDANGVPHKIVSSHPKHANGTGKAGGQKKAGGKGKGGGKTKGKGNEKHNSRPRDAEEEVHHIVKRESCQGKFVRHYWDNKGGVKAAVKMGLAEMFTPGIWNGLLREWSEGSVFEDRSAMGNDSFGGMLDHRW